jgi:3-deoxy-D-arabino-heptulosonate 7-phosphate (DAHP) synthase
MQSFTSGIGSETGNKSGVGSGATTSDRLIETFASGVLCVIGTKNCFARRGETINCGNEIEIAATENHNFVCMRTVGHVSSEPCRTKRNTALIDCGVDTRAISS